MVLTTSGRLDSFVQLFTVLIIFVFVLFLTYYATKWVGNYQKTRMEGSNIQVLETLRLSNTKYLQIVKAGDKCFTIAVCKDTITYLCEIDEKQLVLKNTSTESDSQNFKAILEKFKKDKPKD